MKKQLRSSFSTQGRRMAGARALWAANGMKKSQMGKPIIAIVNSFTQFVPGHVHLHEIGQQVKAEMVLLWGMTECFIHFLHVTSLQTAWNIWSMHIRRMQWYVSATVIKSLRVC